jgi:hypothetical protein
MGKKIKSTGAESVNSDSEMNEMIENTAITRTYNKYNAPTRYEYVFNNHGITAVIERYGQEEASRGDRVVAMLTLSIPCEETHYIPKRLEFGERVKLFNDPLFNCWGVWYESTNTRQSKKSFTATTWKEAFKNAEDYLLSEIKKLYDEINKRKKALQDAEH